jgi:peptidoglycan/xylan/chitin deacetylase (PgdA/CDA1 family)
MIRYSKAITVTLLATVFLVPLLSSAAGPSRIATSDRALWPYALDSEKAFDIASRAEIAALANVWAVSAPNQDTKSWAESLSIKAADTASIKLWQDTVTKIWTANFKKASISCEPGVELFCAAANSTLSWGEIVAYARQQWDLLPKSLAPWAENQQRFYSTYLYEQLRLAALFPRITSEILTMDDQEILGIDYPDKSFLLTFDDGPTAHNGETDQLIALLRRRQLSGVFFLLGEKLNSRLRLSSTANLKAFYDGMCVASHGRNHKPHSQMADWQESIDSTNKTLTSILPTGQQRVKYFRPPYGQRTVEISKYVAKTQQQTMLWNIDSQDWNARITAEQLSGRMVSLMLLWRRGILLFHDVHPKAKKALPEIFRETEKAGVHWLSCY